MTSFSTRAFFILTLLIIPFQAVTAEAHYSDVEHTVRITDSRWYAISREGGFIVSENSGKNWIRKNNGLPSHVVYPFTDNGPVPLLALGVDPTDADRIAVTSYHNLYVSNDGGDNWTELPLAKPVRDYDYITSVAVSPWDDNTYLIGTAYSGMFGTVNRGVSWIDYKGAVAPIHGEMYYVEEISGIAFHPQDPESVYFAGGFGAGLYQTNLTTFAAGEVEFTSIATSAYIRNLYTKAERYGEDSGSWSLDVSTDTGTWRMKGSSRTWDRLPGSSIQRPRLTQPKRERLDTASEKYGIYIKSWNAGDDSIDSFLDFIINNGMNSLVVDVKDDLGRVTYDTALEMPRAMGVVREHIHMETLLKKAHARGVYVIGRLVCFKDPRLYRYDNSKYAIWNYQTQKPWGHLIRQVDPETEEETWVQREFWVDPFAEEVWDYNISIAEELENMGIDEIQFDYIRFPSDGDFTGMYYRHQREGMRRIDALESFLKIARERISIPISTDLYGFNSMFRMGNWIGQCLDMISLYVDVISPMFYPSHYPRAYYKDLDYWERAYTIYKVGSDRSATIVEGRCVIRPYIQAFLIGSEVNFEQPAYVTYLEKQIKGTQESSASGFTLWNNSNRYYMVTKPLDPLLTGIEKINPVLD